MSARGGSPTVAAGGTPVQIRHHRRHRVTRAHVEVEVAERFDNRGLGPRRSRPSSRMMMDRAPQLDHVRQHPARVGQKVAATNADCFVHLRRLRHCLRTGRGPHETERHPVPRFTARSTYSGPVQAAQLQRQRRIARARRPTSRRRPRVPSPDPLAVVAAHEVGRRNGRPCGARPGSPTLRGRTTSATRTGAVDRGSSRPPLALRVGGGPGLRGRCGARAGCSAVPTPRAPRPCASGGRLARRRTARWRCGRRPRRRPAPTRPTTARARVAQAPILRGCRCRKCPDSS